MDETPAPTPHETPVGEPLAIGARLREAREALELSREEVALELHLSSAQIAHLENEDFQRFPAPIFVSGYLRKYARLLGIPDEPLVAAFEGQGVEPPSLHADLTSGMPRPRRINVEYWAGVLVGVGIIILLMVWFFSSGDGDDKVPVPVADSGGQVTPLGEPEAPQPTTPASVGGTAPAAPPVTAPSLSARPEPVQPPRAPQARAAGSESPRAATGTAADARLVLKFNADSWVEISDARGRRLLFDLGKAGQTRVLEGEAPFQILLGYAPGVEIEYNGRPYDHQRHTRNHVARFKLGGD